jgi:predicted nucleic acid-binding protein
VGVTVSLDTNVLLDLLGVNEDVCRQAQAELTAIGDEELIICEAVYAELADRFVNAEELDEFIDDLGVTLVVSAREVLHAAGQAWVNYARTRPTGLVCSSCGRVTAARCESCDAALTIRQRVLPDFYVGAHALANEARLLTRDKRHFRTYFPDLELV